MNFNQIDTTLLKNSILRCIDSINHSSSEEILSEIQSANIWNTLSRDNFKNSLEKMINADYKKLENKLNKTLESIEIIEKYRNISIEIDESKILLNELMLDYENNIEQIDMLNKEIDSKEVELLKIKNTLESYLD